MVKVSGIGQKGRNGNRVWVFFPRLDTGACEVKLTTFICIMVSSSHERVYVWQEDTSDNSWVLNAYIQSYYAELMLENKQKVVCPFSQET